MGNGDRFGCRLLALPGFLGNDRPPPFWSTTLVPGKSARSAEFGSAFQVMYGDAELSQTQIQT